MSLASKHAYRFGYLKSYEWSCVRIAALAREKAKCEICEAESISNDAHHIWYPRNIYDTKVDHVAILCRPCHDFVHVILPDCKTRDEGWGRDCWLKLKNAIVIWRLEKVALFSNSNGLDFLRLKKLCFDNVRLGKLLSKLSGEEESANSCADVLIHVSHCIPDKKVHTFKCGTIFTISRSPGGYLSLDRIPEEEASSPPFSVTSFWGHKRSTRTASDMLNNGDVKMVTAGVLCGIRLYNDGCGGDVEAKAKATTAYLSSLPCQWPCFVHQT